MIKTWFCLAWFICVSFCLSANQVTLKGQTLTMTGLVKEAARQVNQPIRIDLVDPDPKPLFYDCQVSFDAVIMAARGYFKENLGVEMITEEQGGVLVLKAKPREVPVEIPVEVQTLVEQKTEPPAKKKTKRWGFFKRLFEGKRKRPMPEPENENPVQIKKMSLPEDGVEDLAAPFEKPDHDQAWTIPSRIQVEVLPPKRSSTPYQNNEPEDLIQLDVPSSLTTPKPKKEKGHEVKKKEVEPLMELEELDVLPDLSEAKDSKEEYVEEEKDEAIKEAQKEVVNKVETLAEKEGTIEEAKATEGKTENEKKEPALEKEMIVEADAEEDKKKQAAKPEVKKEGVLPANIEENQENQAPIKQDEVETKTDKAKAEMATSSEKEPSEKEKNVEVAVDPEKRATPKELPKVEKKSEGEPKLDEAEKEVKKPEVIEDLEFPDL